RLEDAVRERGTAYRLGGDEFCALVAGDPRELDSLLPELEAALGEAHEAGTVGCSYGVALVPHEAQTASEALALADRRMYERKERDRRSTRLQMRDLLLAVVEEQRPDLHHHSTAVSALSRSVGLALGMSVRRSPWLRVSSPPAMRSTRCCPSARTVRPSRSRRPCVSSAETPVRSSILWWSMRSPRL